MSKVITFLNKVKLSLKNLNMNPCKNLKFRLKPIGTSKNRFEPVVQPTGEENFKVTTALYVVKELNYLELNFKKCQFQD